MVSPGCRGRADLAILGFDVEGVVRLASLWFDLDVKGQLAGNGLNSRLAQARQPGATDRLGSSCCWAAVSRRCCEQQGGE